MMDGMVIVVANNKGGVGKTTNAFNLGHELATMGFKTCLIDNDPQGNLTIASLGTKDEIKAHIKDLYFYNNQKDGFTLPTPIPIKKNLDLIGSNRELAKILDESFEIIYNLEESIKFYKKDYNFIIIDCLTAIGHLLTGGLLSADYAVIPILPEYFAIDALKEALKMVEKVTHPRLNPNLKILGVILNRVPGQKITLCDSIEEQIRHKYGELIFKVKISNSVTVVESPTCQQSVSDYAPGHKTAKEYKALAEELVHRIKRNK
jgi:chromosome partitioning protein